MIHNAVALARLYMAFPQSVPSEQSVSEWRQNTRNGFAQIASPVLPLATNIEIAELLEQMLNSIDQPANTAPANEVRTEDAAHDAYFHVGRVSGDAVRVFARMALSARLILLHEADDAPVTIGSEMLSCIDRALANLAAHLWGDPLPYVERWHSRGTSPRPMARWIRGHQLFAALSQGLIFSFQALGRAIRAGDHEGVWRWADLSIDLLRGSGATFVLTGDFPAEDYLQLVRPSMMAPACPVNLSGLMSADHRYLVQIIRDLKPALKALHEQEPSRHDRLQQELGIVYDRHIHVCERFVGERPSLLTAHKGTKSGPSLIEQFKTLRMKAFDSAIPAHRVGEAATKPGKITESALCSRETPVKCKSPREKDEEV